MSPQTYTISDGGWLCLSVYLSYVSRPPFGPAELCPISPLLTTMSNRHMECANSSYATMGLTDKVKAQEAQLLQRTVPIPPLGQSLASR